MLTKESKALKLVYDSSYERYLASLETTEGIEDITGELADLCPTFKSIEKVEFDPSDSRLLPGGLNSRNGCGVCHHAKTVVGNGTLSHVSSAQRQLLSHDCSKIQCLGFYFCLNRAFHKQEIAQAKLVVNEEQAQRRSAKIVETAEKQKQKAEKKTKTQVVQSQLARVNALKGNLQAKLVEKQGKLKPEDVDDFMQEMVDSVGGVTSENKFDLRAKRQALDEAGLETLLGTQQNPLSLSDEIEQKTSNLDQLRSLKRKMIEVEKLVENGFFSWEELSQYASRKVTSKRVKIDGKTESIN